jgi:ribose transport system substrate-binding protein
MSRTIAPLILLLAALSLVSCGPSGKDGKPTKDGAPVGGTVKVAFVTNNPSDFWMEAKAGVLKAEKDFNAACEFRMPADGTAAQQQQIVEDLMTKGVSGLAISPKDSENQVDLLNKAAARMNVITHDSDAAKSNRLAYIGSNNVTAGKLAGELIKEALPNGGKIVLFVGSIDAQNARERKQGIEEVIKDTKIEIIDVRTDETDRKKAQDNVTDTITKTPDVAALVGLWSYNGPAIAEAVKKADKVGKIKVIAFDGEDGTLLGVKDGVIHGTVVQDPYMFGYESVRVLAALARKEDAKIPASKIVETPVSQVRQKDVDGLMQRTQDRIAAGKAAK